MARPDMAPVVRRHGFAGRVAVLLLAGVLPIAPPSTVLAQETVTPQPTHDRGYGTFIAEASQRFGIPVAWILTVMHAESEHVDDVSSAGAMGLMQLMPDTWTELRARYQLGSDPLDPHDNIIAGTGYLRELLARYGNVSAMLAAYNAGPARYDDCIATGRPLPTETRDYVNKLAPLIGDSPPPEVSVAVLARPGDWRDSSLFVVVTGRGSPSGPPSAGGQSAACPPPTSTNVDTAANASSTDMFVPLAGRYSTP